MTLSVKPLPSLFIIMGVSGTGKSTVAEKLATEQSLTFIDADDFHSAAAKKQMAENIPLTDAMRMPWLLAIIDHLENLYQQGVSVVLAYSGLKLAHRNLFRALPFSCHFFYLLGDKTIIVKRISQRQNHFFSSTLLDSQLEAMESPMPNEIDVSLINIDQPFLLVVNEINHITQSITKKLSDE